MQLVSFPAACGGRAPNASSGASTSFVDGPFDNQTEERPAIDGECEEVGEHTQVTYRWDQQASQNAPAAEDRDGGA